MYSLLKEIKQDWVKGCFVLKRICVERKKLLEQAKNEEVNLLSSYNKEK